MKSDTTTTNPIYTYKGKSYEILSQITDKDNDVGRAEQLLRDFLHCESIGDWGTIKNRINNGLLWGWLRKLTDGELPIGVKEIKEDEQGFW